MILAAEFVVVVVVDVNNMLIQHSSLTTSHSRRINAAAAELENGPGATRLNDAAC